MRRLGRSDPARKRRDPTFGADAPEGPGRPPARFAVRPGDAVLVVATLPLFVLSARWVVRADDALWRDPQLVCLAVLHGSLLLRSRLPWVAFGFACAGVLGLLGAPPLTPAATGLPGSLPGVAQPSTALLAVAIYGAAAHVARHAWIPLLVGLGAAAELTARVWHGLPWLFLPMSGLGAWRGGVALLLTAIVVAAWALGRWRGATLAYAGLGQDWRSVLVERDAAHLDQAVTQQQARMAREAYDVVASNLDSIIDRAGEGRRASRRAPALAGDALGDIATRGEETLGRVRSLMALFDDPNPEEILAHDSGSPVLAPEHDLQPQPQLADLPRLIDAARGEGLAVSLGVVGERARLSVAGELAGYRTVQEALTNTVRHAGRGAVAAVELDWGADGLLVTVDDTRPPGEPDVVAEEDPADPLGLWAGEPRGDIPATVAGADAYVEGRGLRIVRERLEALDGWLDAGPWGDGAGFRVRAFVPRPPGAAEAAGPAGPAGDAETDVTA